ncbi:ABC transporter substrate-binding protein [Alicyclobacillus dauci]|uniref:Sugar ABC transporter substrate-binding protein n=1 Tax=Alicyclobacillus dauci TaxID=1475485 RepID=A0ABY6YX68_9BACL|nr:sugar ABC transporter substrate-binding protein [Alicyclobacillus dauci]WAH35187.1 sugar ABC transporter substrate-binding protein [Alicyclobacillus dauci]
MAVKIRKKNLYVSGLSAVLCFVLVGCGGNSSNSSNSGQSNNQNTSQTGDGFNWKQDSGQTINLLVEQHPWTTAIKPYISEFENQTGIKVNLEIYPEQQARQKALISLQSHSSDFDVFMSLKSLEGLQYQKAGYYTDLTPFLNNPKLTAPGYNLSDFENGPLAGETINNKLVGLPIIVEGPVIFYRKDLFSKYNIPIPKTISDLTTAAAQIEKDTNGSIYGITLRGLPAAVAYTYGPFFHDMGAHWYNSNGKSDLASPSGVKALQLYADLASQYGPPGVVNYTFTQSSSLFEQGKVGMELDSSNEFSSLTNAQQSRVSNDIGVIPFPAGPGGNHPTELQWGISMNSFSQHKDAAWLFMQWSTSQSMQLKLAMKGIASPRTSSWSDPQFQATLKNDEYKQWADAVTETLKNGDPNVGPPAVNESQVRTIIGNMVDSVILKQSTAEQAAQSADNQIDQVISGQ